MNLLFIHEVNWKRKVRYEIHELPELLSLNGHDVQFLDFPEDTSRSGWHKMFQFRTEISDVLSHTYNASRVRVVTPGKCGPFPLDRLLASFTFVPELIRVLRSNHIDVVILYGVPTNGWQTILIARYFQIPVIYRALDISHLIRKTKFKRLVRVAERFIYRNASWISANNQVLRTYCIENGGKRENSSVDYPGLEKSHFQFSEPDSSLMYDLDLSETDVVAIFLGTLFSFCGLDRVIEDLATFNKKGRVKLLIVGDGEYRATLEHLSKQLGLDDQVMFVGQIDFKELKRYLSVSQVAIVPFQPSLVADAAFPWKVVQYIAAGLPVVATPLAGLLTVFPEGQGVTYVETSHNLIQKLYEITQSQEKSHQIVSRGQAIVQEKFLWKTNIKKFESLFESFVQQKSI